MIYVMSDIHGEHSRYISMLETINFSDEDTLYILGDVIDRKPGGIDILRDIMHRPNVHMILGNHEKMMLDTFWSNNDYDAKRLWRGNGGHDTYREMVYVVPTEERHRILRFVQELPDHLDIEVNGRKFHLVHGMPADNQHDRIWGRPEPLPMQPMIPGKTVILGHICVYWLNQYVDGHDEDAPWRI